MNVAFFKYMYCCISCFQIDCCLFGFIIQITDVPMQFPMRHTIEKECKNILEFVERMKLAYWPDYDEQSLSRE